jgi:ATP-dependent phosphofructokinase / diphosphate-dependent phosphofructokinase
VKIGILTGGGDVPGLNACIKAATLRATEEGHEVVGIRRGWGGLLETDPDDQASVQANIVDLDAAAVRTIDRTGGTVLHTSRTNPAKVRPSEEPAFLRSDGRDRPVDHTPHVLKVLDRLGIDALVPIGGDDTLSFALRLH